MNACLVKKKRGQLDVALMVAIMENVEYLILIHHHHIFLRCESQAGAYWDIHTCQCRGESDSYLSTLSLDLRPGAEGGLKNP